MKRPEGVGEWDPPIDIRLYKDMTKEEKEEYDKQRIKNHKRFEEIVKEINENRRKAEKASR